MEKTYHIKLITGFRKDQFVSVPMQEAHKAYYLFKNPDARAVFNNGVALAGRHIQQIWPDWNKTMGWLDGHDLDQDDFVQIRKEGVENRMKALIEKAKEIGDLIASKPELMQLPMGEVIKTLPVLKENPDVKKLADKFSQKNG